MNNNEMMKLTKKELINLINGRDGIIKYQKIRLNNKISMIRHLENRLKRIRDSIDYLLKHPYSIDCNTQTRKHERDTKRG